MVDRGAGWGVGWVVLRGGCGECGGAWCGAAGDVGCVCGV